VDHILRRNLIEALKNRRWTHLDAERAAESVAELYDQGDAAWEVWRSEVVADPDSYGVARDESDVSVYRSLLEGRARDVAIALNELERRDSDATGTH
jgi:hypothetical protein